MAESSATTPALSSSDLEEMERRIARVFAVREELQSAYDSRDFARVASLRFELREASESFEEFAAPERIFALIEAARRGSEDTERLDWFQSKLPRVGLDENGETRLLDRGDGSLLASAPTFRQAADATRTLPAPERKG